MTKVTIKYLKKVIQHEKQANRDYMKHGITNIAKDERDHRRILIRKLKKLEKKLKE